MTEVGGVDPQQSDGGVREASARLGICCTTRTSLRQSLQSQSPVRQVDRDPAIGLQAIGVLKVEYVVGYNA